MKRFKNILLVSRATESDEAALYRAVRLAKENRARLTVCGVLDLLPRDMQWLVVSLPPADLQEIAQDRLRRQLDRFVAPARRAGLRPRVEVLCGTPFLEIIRDVLRHRRDLVLTTAEARRGWKQWFLGNTAMRLMRKCPCPVWVIKPAHRKPYARILAAVDPDPADPVKSALNRSILELASSLARTERSRLHIVHAWSHFAEDTLRKGQIHLPRADVDRLIREERNKHKKWLDDLLQMLPLDGIAQEVHLVKGPPPETIARLAEKHRVELIVMGTVCRTGLAGFLIGNTAETVLRQVNCSVLTVKPKGFVTPVQRTGKERTTP
jgi:universal stress protein E